MTTTLATELGWATVQSEPWANSPIVWTPPTNERWCDPLAVNVRLGFQVMFETRAELEANWLANEERWAEALDRLHTAREELEHALMVVAAAQARLLAAASVILERGCHHPAPDGHARHSIIDLTRQSTAAAHNLHQSTA